MVNKNSPKKAQSAVELMILLGFVIFFFIVFVGVIQGRTSDKTYEKKDIIIKDVVKTVQEEITLASQSTDGYYRNFKIPEKIINDEYDITIVNGLVYARTADQRHAVAVFILNVTGEINKTLNTITKQEGVVYLNV